MGHTVSGFSDVQPDYSDTNDSETSDSESINNYEGALHENLCAVWSGDTYNDVDIHALPECQLLPSCSEPRGSRSYNSHALFAARILRVDSKYLQSIPLNRHIGQRTF